MLVLDPFYTPSWVLSIRVGKYVPATSIACAGISQQQKSAAFFCCCCYRWIHSALLENETLAVAVEKSLPLCLQVLNKLFVQWKGCGPSLASVRTWQCIFVVSSAWEEISPSFLSVVVFYGVFEVHRGDWDLHTCSSLPY